MTPNTLIWAILKPKLRRQFGLKEIYRVEFTADKIADTLDLTCIGLVEGMEGVKKVDSKTLKLSENEDHVNLFIEQTKEEIKDIHVLNAAFLTVDFKNKKCSTHVFYLNEAGEKKDGKAILKF